MENPALAMSVLSVTYLRDVAAKPSIFALRKLGIRFVINNFTKLDLGLLLNIPEPKVRADVLFALQQKLRRMEEKGAKLEMDEVYHEDELLY
jgi:hypothetical protein